MTKRRNQKTTTLLHPGTLKPTGKVVTWDEAKPKKRLRKGKK